MAEPETAQPMSPMRVGSRLWVRLLVGVAVGVGVGALAPLPAEELLMSRALVAFVAAALAFSVPLLWRMMQLDADATRATVDGLDPTRSELDLVVVVAAVASLVGIGVMLLGAGPPSRREQVTESVVSILTVASAWLLVHTTYALRYARHWYNAQPGSIDFGSTTPRFSDFAYLSFTLGMTYQVSDTALTTPEVRRIVLGHTVLSYLFGTVVVAVTINLVAGLAR